MRELYRTEEGTNAWRSTTTDANSRRLLGGLVQPQPEEHLKLVLSADDAILLESLMRRGWVAWRQVSPPPSMTKPDDVLLALDNSSEDGEPAASETMDFEPGYVDSAAAVALPPMISPPPVSREEVESSLEEFFRRLGN